jgi:hypothetical protein
LVISSDISQRAEVIHTLSRLERFDGVPTGGTMVALPALDKSGLLAHVEQLFPTPIDRHIQEIALTLIAAKDAHSHGIFQKCSLPHLLWKRHADLLKELVANSERNGENLVLTNNNLW